MDPLHTPWQSLTVVRVACVGHHGLATEGNLGFTFETLSRHKRSVMRKKLLWSKEKRGPKRKSSARVVAQAKRARKNEVEVAEDEIEAQGLGNYCSVFPTLVWIG
jgi:hypothetical protein